MNHTASSFVVIGADFRVMIEGEGTAVGAIVQGIIDATLGVDDSITVQRVK